MKDIGIKLKEKREANGLSVEEAADDMKMRPSQIESLEAGRKEDFKDVAMLKLFIRDYAKYLGLDGDKMIDDFNEFLFDFTSKIPLDEINKANNNSKKKEVASPYTSVGNKNLKYRFVILAIIITLILVFVGYIIVGKINHSDFKNNNTTYVIRR